MTKRTISRTPIEVLQINPSHEKGKAIAILFQKVIIEQLVDDGIIFTSVTKRTLRMLVPADKTIQDVQNVISNDACLYSIIANTPIIKSHYTKAVELIGDLYLIRDPEGLLILSDSGKVQYNILCFFNKPHEDVDLRDNPDYPEYKSSAVKEELN